MSKFFKLAFSQSGHRCVYCCRDLLADFDSFMLAEEDHLVPLGNGGTDTQENVVIACAVCNRLKGNYAPDTGFDSANRNGYIIAVRHYIMGQRAKHIDTFSGWACLPAP
jgi:CRISPR/Cas system Type II protein with McrA/HNH and RuvC-like nuclease domain